MNKDIKLRLLLAPLIFMVLLHVPIVIGRIAYECMHINIFASPEVIRTIYVVMLWIPVLIWAFTFYHISIGVYIAMLVVYTAVSWTWILRKKKGNAMYFIVWIILCALSVILYWKCEPEYYIMLNG